MRSGKLKESGVLLGFVDIPISKSEKPNIEDTFIGGEPIWLDVNSPPPSELVLCRNCHDPMRLLLQTYAPLSDSIYDRLIYIFGCNKAGCRRKEGSIRAIRAIRRNPDDMKSREIEYKKEEEKERKKVSPKERKPLFSASTEVSSNPFESNPFKSNCKKNPFAIPKDTAEDDSMNITASEYKNLIPKQLHKPATNHVKLPSFKGSLVYIEDEILDPSKQVIDPTLKNIKTSTNGSSKMDDSFFNSKELENIMKKVDDPTFRKFSDVISFNPTQVLRYQFGGIPLFYNVKDEAAHLFYDNRGKLLHTSKLPKPSYHPNGHRVFELQLMPQAIIPLEKDSNIDILKDGMEWGTILVGCDSEDYVPDSSFDENYVAYVEEWCGVQWEEEVTN